MKNKKLLLIILPLLMMCLLTGCRSYNGIRCLSCCMPENAEIYYLIYDPGQEYTVKPSTYGQPVPDIFSYSENGWRCAGKELFDDYENKKCEKIQKFSKIKIAVTDKSGNIQKISPEFDLLVEGRHYYWSKIEYNYDNNEIKGVHDEMLFKYTDIYGIYLLCILAGIPFIIILLITSLTITPHTYKPYFWVYLLLDIPALVSSYCALRLIFDKSYQPVASDDFLQPNDLFPYFISVYIFLNCIAWVRYCFCRRSYRKELREAGIEV